MDAHQILNSLLQWDQPLAQLTSLVQELDWDSEEELVFLSPNHIQSALERFLKGEVTASEVESWANLIEGREDVGFQTNTETLLKELIYELANPTLTHPLTQQTANAWLQRLKS